MKKQSGKKLVEILAVELKEWPEGFLDVGQASEGSLHLPGIGDHVRHTSERYTLADDWMIAIVTRAQWEAERAKLSKPKANAQGWIRHRGRKNPFDVCTLVDARLRSGVVVTGKFSENLHWLHTGNNFDVMAYRVNESVELKAAESVEVKAEQPYLRDKRDIESDPEGILLIKSGDTLKAYRPDINPIQWRDRVTEIDREVEALEEERAILIQKLADEGLQLLRDFAIKALESAGQPDMSDWCNWQIGDLLEVVKNEFGHKFQIGEIVRMKSLPTVAGGQIKCEHIDSSGWWWLNNQELKFHSRPTK